MSFVNSSTFQNFLRENPESGTLKIRAFAASQAVPIKGLRVVVSKVIDDDNVIFFDGLTNESGIIENIVLPAPKLNSDNMNVPNRTTYDITATYIPDNIVQLYIIMRNRGDNIKVLGNVNRHNHLCDVFLYKSIQLLADHLLESLV